MSAEVSELVRRAGDPSLGVDLRAQAAVEALEEASPRLAVDAEVVSEVARTHGFRKGLTVALHCDGDCRVPNLRRALEHKGDHPGDEGVTNALLELGRMGPELIDSLTDEVRRQAAERPRPSPMFLGAWGIHLVRAIKLMGDDGLRELVHAAAEAVGDDFDLIEEALALAPLEGDEAQLRDELPYLLHVYWSAWYTGRSEDAEVAGSAGPPPPNRAAAPTAEAGTPGSAGPSPPSRAVTPPAATVPPAPEELGLVPVVSRLTWLYFMCLMLPWLAAVLYFASWIPL